MTVLSITSVIASTNVESTDGLSTPSKPSMPFVNLFLWVVCIGVKRFTIMLNSPCKCIVLCILCSDKTVCACFVYFFQSVKNRVKAYVDLLQISDFK